MKGKEFQLTHLLSKTWQTVELPNISRVQETHPVRYLQNLEVGLGSVGNSLERVGLLVTVMTGFSKFSDGQTMKEHKLSL